MNSSSSPERVTDSLDRVWILGPPLGRGTWGRTRVIRDPQGRQAVLKEPLTESDFPSDGIDMSPLAEACQACAVEQAALLEAAEFPFLTRIEATATLEDGRTALVMPRYAGSLEQYLQAGMPLEDVLRAVVDVGSMLASARRVHGNLRPSNVLFADDGTLALSDLATPAIRQYRQHLVEIAMAEAWSPPEATARPMPMWDTWGLAQILHAACHALPGVDPPPPPAVAKPGLDKAALSELKARMMTRLEDEGTNPRFRTRLADRMGALLSRALSSQVEPSPPYRFATCEPFTERVREVRLLVRPQVDDVGQIMLPGRADDATFRGGELVEFTVTVGCTHDVTDHEDLVCGIQVTDLDAAGDGRVQIENAQFAVQMHPSGRLRYKLGLPELGPGRYRVKVAFAVAESGHAPQTAETTFEVRPPPGYVPPRRDPPPSPLPFPATVATSNDAPDASSELGDDGTLHTDESVLTDEEPPLPPFRPTSEPGFPAPVAPPTEADPDDMAPLYEPRSLTVPPRSVAVPVSADLDAVPPPDGEVSVADDLVADLGDDLPRWQSGPAEPPAPLPRRLADAVKQDSTSVALAIVACTILVAALSFLIRAC